MSESQENALAEEASTIDSSAQELQDQFERDKSGLVTSIPSKNSIASIQSDLHQILTSCADVSVDVLPSTSQVAAVKDKNTADADCNEDERSCWICFATDDDNRLAAWVQPCKCRGTTKWVHQSCLYRWVDEKQKGNALRAVSCQQCQTEYIIVFPHMGKFANILEAFDSLIKRISPFLAAGVLVGSLYWTAVTYGAVTFLQVIKLF